MELGCSAGLMSLIDELGWRAKFLELGGSWVGGMG